MKSYLTSFLALTLGIALLASCGEEPASTTGTNGQAESSALKHVVLSAKPTDIKTISALKKAAPKAGDSITVQGRIGGEGSPFIDGHAAFLLADDTVLAACDITDDGHCPKPWDYCCEDKTKLRSNIATVQIVGEDKSVIKESADGLAGLKAGSFVVITGTVSDKSSAENLIINATGIFHDAERKIAKKADHKHEEGHKH